MLVDSEHAVQTVALAIGERVRTGSEDSADPVKGIPKSTAMPAGDLLDPLPAAVQCVTGHGPNPVTSRYTLICEEPAYPRPDSGCEDACLLQAASTGLSELNG